MSKNQMHGVALEEFVFDSGVFVGAKILKGKRNLLHDIPKTFDLDLGLNTSIKALKKARSMTICLADALRFYNTTKGESLRLLIGIHEQRGNEKVFVEMIEIILDKKHFPKLWGDLSEQDIEYLKGKIHGIAAGDHEWGRKAAKEWKKPYQKRCGIVTLNQKVGSKSGPDMVRRLQCSITMNRLLKMLKDEKDAVRRHKSSFGDLELPFAIDSSARENASAKARAERLAAEEAAKAEVMTA